VTRITVRDDIRKEKKKKKDFWTGYQILLNWKIHFIKIKKSLSLCFCKKSFILTVCINLTLIAKASDLY